MHAWVGKLDEAVEEKLGLRLQAGIEAWTNALLGKNSEKDEDDQENMDTHASMYYRVQKMDSTPCPICPYRLFFHYFKNL